MHQNIFFTDGLAPSSFPRTRESRERLEESPMHSLDSRVRGNDGAVFKLQKSQEFIRERYIYAVKGVYEMVANYIF